MGYVKVTYMVYFNDIALKLWLSSNAINHKYKTNNLFNLNFRAKWDLHYCLQEGIKQTKGF